MSDLPEGWAAATLGDFIATLRTGPFGSSVHKTDYIAGGHPLINPMHINGGKVVPSPNVTVSDAKAQQLSEFAMKPGDIIIGRRGEMGRCAVITAEQEGWLIGTGSMAIKTTGGLFADFLQRFLSSPTTVATLTESSIGSTMANLNQSILSGLQIAVPPLPEQRRIVAKVDDLTARTARARKELDRIPTLIARYKQRLLALAFSGELTAGWRAKDANVSQDTIPSALAQYTDDSERGVWEWETLPARWDWVPFGSAFTDVTDSKRKIQTQEYRAQGRFPVIDQGMAQIAGYTDREDMAQLAKPPYVVFGDHTRCVKLVGSRFVQGADGVKVLNPTAAFDASYLYFALQCVQLPDKGYSRHMKFLRATHFPKCSLPEQAEIVRRIESAFGWLDRMAANQAAAARLLPKLDAAILGKAFKGNLVPQNPNDEPAAKLLERVKAEQEADAAKPKKTRGRPHVHRLEAIGISTGSPDTGTATLQVTQTRKKAAIMSKSRQNDDVKDKPYLAGLLKSGRFSDTQSLFRTADLPVADFYKQLAWEISAGHIIDSTEELKAA